MQKCFPVTGTHAQRPGVLVQCLELNLINNVFGLTPNTFTTTSNLSFALVMCYPGTTPFSHLLVWNEPICLYNNVYF